MSNTKRGLGRGLGALIPTTPTEHPQTENNAMLELRTDQVIANPRQPRHYFDENALQELAASIREHGLIQPLVVTKAPEKSTSGEQVYYLIAGERRWRASQLAGLSKVPVVVKEASDQALLEMALVENVQRADLNPLEEAEAYNMLIEDFGLTQGQVAERMGKARVTITNSLRLLRLGTTVKNALLTNAITEAHGRALVGLTENQQEEALNIVLDRHLTVRQTEELALRLMIAATETDQPSEIAEEDKNASHIHAMESKLRERFGTKVEINRSVRGRGRMIIHFYSDEELESVYSALAGEPEF